MYDDRSDGLDIRVSTLRSARTTRGRQMDKDTDQRREAIDRLARASPPQWVHEMNEHYSRTGSVRPQDLRRLLGDQTVGVKFESDPKPASFHEGKQS